MRLPCSPTCAPPTASCCGRCSDAARRQRDAQRAAAVLAADARRAPLADRRDELLDLGAEPVVAALALVEGEARGLRLDRLPGLDPHVAVRALDRQLDDPVAVVAGHERGGRGADRPVGEGQRDGGGEVDRRPVADRPLVDARLHAHDRAVEQPGEAVEAVVHLQLHDAAAGRRIPVPGGSAGGAVDDRVDRQHRVAELAGREHPLRRRQLDVEAVAEADHQPHVGARGRGDHAVGVGQVGAERLVDEQVQPGLGGGDRCLGVQVVGQADVERVDLPAGDERFPRGVRARAEALGDPRAADGVRVRDRPHLDAVERRGGRRDALAHDSAAGDPEPDQSRVSCCTHIDSVPIRESRI